MCGIVGTIGLADRELISAMKGAITHRGPDDHGTFIDEVGRVALGHRRLSIIDLSSAGHQPMSYMDERFWIVYNGEVYNYKDIRAELEAKGYAFISNTDTEVLLAAYAEWGQDFLKKLRGMFAFAIYDRKTAQVFLARDRFGIKPLYYFHQNGIFLFASELKALLASGRVPSNADPQAIWDYLSIGSIPQPRTILCDVQALLPGHAMIVSLKGEVSIHQYWDIWENAQILSSPIDLKEASAELRQKLEEATRLQMIADVPVGAFLSGGTDSTAVVGLMSQYVSHPIKTYSVGFESQYAKLNELKWAKIASERFGTDHTEVIVTENDIAQSYDSLVQGIDQPSLDGTNTYFVSKAAHTGVTVSLSGQGGDELFAGYPHFSDLMRASDWDRRFPAWFRSLCKPIIKATPGRFLPDKHWLASTPLERYALLRNLADELTKSKITRKEFRAGFKAHPLTEAIQPFLKPSQDSVALTSYVEIKNYLANTLLRDGDAVSMAHSLEVRPVLLDHVLVEYVFALPSRLKLNHEGGKRVLIDALRDLIPEPILTRPKMGFEMPLFDWLSGPLKARALDTLSSSPARKIFTERFREEAQGNIQEPLKNDRRLWGYVMLIEWLNANHCNL
jgi:asparagine synthase (glutamine-hydrolysing)